jgi:hypothetical protein
MKKLLIIGLLFLATISANAQDTIFRGNNPDYVNSIKLNIKYPAAKWSIILDPLATLGDGIALGADFFIGRLQFRALGAYHTGETPWFYRDKGFGYSSFNLKDFNGFRLEFQLRKDLTEDLSESSRFGAGVFANFRSVTINGTSTYTFNPNPGGSSIGSNTSLNGQAFTFGPIFTFSEHGKMLYFDMHLGPGMIIDVGGNNNDVVGLDVVSPYKPGVMIKFGAVIGLNMK